MKKSCIFLKESLVLLLTAISLQAAPHVVQIADPLESLYGLRGTATPAEDQPVRHLHLLSREFGLSALSIHNPGPGVKYYRITSEGFDRVSLTIREGVHIRERKGNLPADILPALSSDAVISIPAGENRQIFLEFDTRDCAPGLCQGAIRIMETADKQSTLCRYLLDISARRLPEKHPLQVMTWDCSLRQSQGAEKEALMQELKNHYVNNFHVIRSIPWKADKEGNITSQPDFSSLDSELDFLRGKGRMLLRCAAPSRHAPSIETAAGQKAYGNFIRLLAEHLKSRKLSHDDYVLYPFDESTGNKFSCAAKVIRQTDPKILIYADPCSSRMEIENISATHDYVDYMQISTRLLSPYQLKQSFASMRSERKITSVYWCPELQKSLPPDWYRNMGHFAWRFNLDGVGYWSSLWLKYRQNLAANHGWAHPWDDFSDKWASPVTVYPGRNGRNIPSRRWKAFRAGLEDWLIFDLVRRQGNTALLRKINRITDMEKPDKKEFLKIRTQAINFLAEGK